MGGTLSPAPDNRFLDWGKGGGGGWRDATRPQGPRNYRQTADRLKEAGPFVLRLSYVRRNVLFLATLDYNSTYHFIILKKTTTLLNLQNMFRQKLLSSSVDRFTKR